MNTPNHVATTKNGIILYSNRMPDALGIHSYITEKGEIKTERVDAQKFSVSDSKENVIPALSLCVIGILVLFLGFYLSSYVRTLIVPTFAIYMFLILSRKKLPSLYKKFRYVRTKSNYKNFSLAFDAICQFDELPNVTEVKKANNREEYSDELALTVFDVFFSLEAGLFMNSPSSRNTILIFLVTTVAIPLGISIILSPFVVKHFERFFVSSANEQEIQTVLDGLNEWTVLEQEIEESFSSPFLKE